MYVFVLSHMVIFFLPNAILEFWYDTQVEQMDDKKVNYRWYVIYRIHFLYSWISADPVHVNAKSIHQNKQVVPL